MERTRTVAQRPRQREQHELPLREAPEAAVPIESEQAANVQVISGASVQALPLAGLQVARARELVGALLNIAPGAPVLVNGAPVSSDYRLTEGDVLEFVHHAGEKGSWLGPSH